MCMCVGVWLIWHTWGGQKKTLQELLLSFHPCRSHSSQGLAANHWAIRPASPLQLKFSKQSNKVLTRIYKTNNGTDALKLHHILMKAPQRLSICMFCIGFWTADMSVIQQALTISIWLHSCHKLQENRVSSLGPLHTCTVLSLPIAEPLLLSCSGHARSLRCSQPHPSPLLTRVFFHLLPLLTPIPHTASSC